MREGQKREFARRLRKTMTDAEQRVWYHLRDRRLLEAKFRRQVPIGRYVVDFVCLDAGLIVEIDGGQHNGSLHDVARDRFLGEQGFSVLRFWNNDVLTDLAPVLACICQALASPPSPAEG
ncbi:MAG: endonuclease domain-containing protein [Lysobacter sp.]